MITRFVYPKLDMFYANRGMKEAKQLLITSTTDDGCCWFGIKDAIKNYLAEYGIDIKNVRWIVNTDYEDFNATVEIKANTVTEWVKKFNALDVKFKPIPEEKWI